MKKLSKRELRKALRLTAEIERHRLAWWAAAMDGDDAAMIRHDAKALGKLGKLGKLVQP